MGLPDFRYAGYRRIYDTSAVLSSSIEISTTTKLAAQTMAYKT